MRPLHFGFVTPQHRMSIDDIRRLWDFADSTGWDSAWVFDHLISLDGPDDGPCLEAWSLLAAMAERTRRVELGAFVSAVTHRSPGMLAKQAVTVDHLSGGRLILGIGAAWNAREHAHYGLDFPSLRERVDRVGEALELFRIVEREPRANYRGEFYRLSDAPFEPKFVRARVPVLVGTKGPRMMRHLARWADAWEGGGSPEQMLALGRELDRACEEVGRDPAEISRGILADNGSPAKRPLAGVAAFRKHVEAYVRVGVDTFYFNIAAGPPSKSLRAISEEAIPALREAHAAGALAGAGDAQPTA
jgi:alkanesulfonate monooxygenase SsuD/methylene tetrahydromethanopterin reductase-like flavin-dependent oxidoreductase (luciferase family)